MPKLIKTILLSALLMYFSSLDMMSQTADWKKSQIDSFRDSTLLPALDQDLWKPAYAYNATHYLMPSLHGFLSLKDTNAISAFHRFFKTFTERGIQTLDSAAPLSRFHFWYLISEYLCCYKPSDTSYAPKLQDYLHKSLIQTWVTDSAARWSHPRSRFSYAPNMRWNVLWKLQDKTITIKTYHKAITDDELFVMAAGCNLIRCGMKNDTMLQDMQNLMYQCLQQNGSFNSDKSWLFQVGYWSQYKDYRYAGNKTYAGENIRESKIKDIAEDASHSLRYPVWFISLEKSFTGDEIKANAVREIREGFAKQALIKVIHPADSVFPWPRLTNYMDGNNGIYRWHYNGRPGGTLPFGNSATFWLGWWGYFPNNSASIYYDSIVRTSILQSTPLPVFNIAPDSEVFPGIANKRFLLLNSLLASIPGLLNP